MKQSAMQDLREDLILTQTSAEESLLEIENQEIREACQEVISLTLKNIIKRIDEELLEMEKQQIIDAGNTCAFLQHIHEDKVNKMSLEELEKYAEEDVITCGEQYYNETFKNK
jgi:predicted subunit of tRNA(5-methylaminomethyl-2-thiouridylate) methyltransferase